MCLYDSATCKANCVPIEDSDDTGMFDAIIVEMGANLELLNGKNQTSLHLACKGGKLDLVVAGTAV